MSSTVQIDGSMSLIYNNFLIDFLLSTHIRHLLVSSGCWSPLKYARVGNILIYADVQAASNFGILSPIVSANWSYFNGRNSKARTDTAANQQPPRLQLFSTKNNCLHVHYLPIAENSNKSPSVHFSKTNKTDCNTVPSMGDNWITGLLGNAGFGIW